MVCINYILGHVCEQVGCVFYRSEMEDEKFELLMSELRATREKFDASIAEVK